MTQVVTYRTREDGFLLLLVEFVDTKTFLVFLLDPWKTGYRDFDEHRGNMKQIKRKIGIPSIKFHEIPKKEAALLLRQNYEIAQKLNVVIEPEAEKWFEKLGVFKLEYSQALYQCFNCEVNDLPEDQISDILEIAKREIADQVIGTDKEEQYFKICDSCEQDLHNRHDNQEHHHH